jgi:hypothetical protein
MSNNCNQNKGGVTSGFENSTSEVSVNQGDKVAQSLPGKNTYTLEEKLTAEDAEQVGLTRGTYKIVSTIPYEGKGKIVRGVTKSIPQNNEFKRIRFDKIDIVPTDELINGQPAGKMTIVAEVIDNPIWLPALVYGGLAIGSLTAGYFFIDKVEEFSNESIIPLGAMILTGIGLYLGIKK